MGHINFGTWPWRNPDHALDSAVIDLAAQCGNTNLDWPKWGILISALDLGGRFRPRQADSGVQGKGLGYLYIISAFLQLFHSMQVRDYLLIYIFIFFALLIISRLVSAKPPIFNNINKALAGLLNKFYIIYLNNILIFSDSKKEYIDYIK